MNETISAIEVTYDNWRRQFLIDPTHIVLGRESFRRIRMYAMDYCTLQLRPGEKDTVRGYPILFNEDDPDFIGWAVVK